MAGAYFGARAAQQITESTKRREDWLVEVRNTNATIMVAFAIWNTATAMKKQNVGPLKHNFDAARTARADFKSKIDAGTVPSGSVFEFLADFRFLQPPLFPAELLRTQVFEKLSIVERRPYALISTLLQSLDGLTESIRKRNEWIEHYRPAFASNRRLLVTLYFGDRYGDGHVDVTYPESVEAISRQTDDVIYFSYLLCEDLRQHGERLLQELKGRRQKHALRIVEIDIAKARAEGLMPPDSQYSDWLTGFPMKRDRVSWVIRMRTALRRRTDALLNRNG